MRKIFTFFTLIALQISVQNSKPAAAQTLPTFSIVDGKTNATLLTAPATLNADQGNGVKVEQTLANTTASPRIWKTTVTNTDSQQRWFLLRWNITWAGNGKFNQLSYWNGRRNPITGDGLLSAHGGAAITAGSGTMMLQTIYDKENGLSLALSPREIVSDFEHSLLASQVTQQNGTGKFTLQLQIPLVLDAGQSDTFPIEIYRYKPRYGYLDAVQSYYDSHPEAFWPRKNVDQRAAGVGAAYTAWNEFSFERTRRFGGDWDWGYAPYKRSGDLYGREEYWNYEPGRPMHEPMSTFTIPAFHEWRKKRFNNATAAGVGMLFYTPSFFYIEEKLAQDHFPDAILRNPDGNITVRTTTPNVTGYDNELMLFPFEKKFAQHNMTDAKQVIEENNAVGMAYDVAAGGILFRGKGTEGLTRRAFDASGPVIDLSVGVARMMDYTRELEKNGKKVGLVANPTGNTRAFLAARADSAMYERAPYKVMEEVMPLRFNLGHKALTWWSGWSISDMVDVKRMTPAELREAYVGAADYVELFSYRYGGYPSILLSQGVPKLTRALPKLKEVIKTGWQAVPAVRVKSGTTPDFVWPARYGNGLSSYITLGNADETAWSGTIVVDNDYVGQQNYLFADTEGKILSQKIVGRTTEISVKLAPRSVLVLRAIATVAAGNNGAATTSWSDNGQRGQLQIKTTLKLDKTATLRSGWTLLKATGGTLSFASPYFTSPVKEVVEFPFYGASDKTSNAAIVLPPNPSPEEEWAAEHIQNYFKFWGEKGLAKTTTIDLKTYRGTAPKIAGLLLIYIGGKNSGIKRQGTNLYIGSTSSTNLHDTTLKLFAALDTKYFYCGTFPGYGEGPNEADTIKKAGLMGGLVGVTQ